MDSSLNFQLISDEIKFCFCIVSCILKSVQVSSSTSSNMSQANPEIEIESYSNNMEAMRVHYVYTKWIYWLDM